MYIYIYIYTHTCREREREIDIDRYRYTHISVDHFTSAPAELGRRLGSVSEKQNEPPTGVPPRAPKLQVRGSGRFYRYLLCSRRSPASRVSGAVNEWMNEWPVARRGTRRPSSSPPLGIWDKGGGGGRGVSHSHLRFCAVVVLLVVVVAAVGVVVVVV